METLMGYDWPGNVRELANVLERAQILAEDKTITPDDLPENLVTFRAEDEHGAESPDPHNLHQSQRRHVLAVLKEARGNKVHAARALGISRRALYRLLDKYQIRGAEGLGRHDPGGP